MSACLPTRLSSCCVWGRQSNPHQWIPNIAQLSGRVVAGIWTKQGWGQAGWGWGGGFVKEMPSLDLTGRSLQRNSQRRTVLSLDQKLFGQWPRQHRGPGGPESPPGCLQGSRLQQWVPAAVAFWAQGRRGGWLGAQGLHLPSRPRCPAIPLRQDQNLSGDDDRPPRWQQQWLQKSRTQSLLP